METSLRALVTTIVDRHHSYVRRALSTLPPLLAADGARAAQALFAGLALELQSHMKMEEDVLFPWVESVARALERGDDPPEPDFGDPEGPLSALEEEHVAALSALARLDALAATAPSAAAGLRAFHADMKEHIRLEDDLLFPALRELFASS